MSWVIVTLNAISLLLAYQLCQGHESRNRVREHQDFKKTDLGSWNSFGWQEARLWLKRVSPRRSGRDGGQGSQRLNQSSVPKMVRGVWN